MTFLDIGVVTKALDVVKHVVDVDKQFVDVDIESRLILRVMNGEGGKLLKDDFLRFFRFDKCFRMASAAWRNLALLPVSKPLFRFRFGWLTKIGSSSENRQTIF